MFTVLKVMSKINVFKSTEGLVTRNTNMPLAYESSGTFGLKVINKVKVSDRNAE